MIEHLLSLIGTSNLPDIVRFMFEREQNVPVLKQGFYHEGECWDFKTEVPGYGKAHEVAWAEIARHTMAFHNARGGLLIFGINDHSLRFTGAKNLCDSARFNNAIRRYVGDLFHVIFDREFIQADQRYLGIALIPARGPRIVRFAADAPVGTGSRLFSRGDIAVREGDTSRIHRGIEADTYFSNQSTSRVGRGYFVDEESYRILAPEYKTFVYRKRICQEIIEGLQDSRTSTVSLTGIGGVGKTALATWAVMEAYRSSMYSFIVSITAKDRELTSKSIVPLEPQLTTYEELINTVLKVLRMEDGIDGVLQERERFVKELLANSNGLLYIDNLETVDDSRIIEFLNKLPHGVKAIVTSRIPRVKRFDFPVEVGPFEDHEILDFVEAMTAETQYVYLNQMNSTERLEFGVSCNRIPLAMRWIAARCKSTKEVLSRARDINRTSKTNEELLEFSFRRIFDDLKEPERTILKVLSVYRRPLGPEAIHIASGINYQTTVDLLENLKASSLLEIQYDDELNSNSYGLLPITATFVYGEVKNNTGLEAEVRKRMKDWLEANDERDPVRRSLLRGVRQGQDSTEHTLLQLARDAKDIVDKENLYQEAIKRYPKSWMAHRAYAEFLRHWTKEIGKAIEHYRLAAEYVPKSEKFNRPVIFRELGILLSKSGHPDGLVQAIESLEVSFGADNRDPITANVLGTCYVKAGRTNDALKILNPFRNHHDLASRSYILNTLLQCYELIGDPVEIAYVRQELRNLKQDSNH